MQWAYWSWDRSEQLTSTSPSPQRTAQPLCWPSLFPLRILIAHYVIGSVLMAKEDGFVGSSEMWVYQLSISKLLSKLDVVHWRFWLYWHVFEPHLLDQSLVVLCTLCLVVVDRHWVTKSRMIVQFYYDELPPQNNQAQSAKEGIAIIESL